MQLETNQTMKKELNVFFQENNRLALAFSGGTDSTYLMYAAREAGADITAYFVKSQFQPMFELEDARRLADELNCRLKVLEIDVMKHDEIVSNQSHRCYYCKKLMFETIATAAKTDGYTVIIDGTNASDDASDRPGMRALSEMNIISPLRLCGITKPEVRKLSEAAGLRTCHLPSYSCLATRIKTGEIITEQKLEAIEKSENYLKSLGIRDFRVRVSNDKAGLELRSDDSIIVDKNKSDIIEYLGKYFGSVDLGAEDK